MCWEDIRIGRRLERLERRKTTGGGGAELLIAAEPRRVRLLVCPTKDGDIQIGSRQLQPGGGQGITLSASWQPLVMRVEDFGDWIAGEIYVDDNAIPNAVTVIEWLLPIQNPFVGDK